MQCAPDLNENLDCVVNAGNDGLTSVEYPERNDSEGDLTKENQSSVPSSVPSNDQYAVMTSQHLLNLLEQMTMKGSLIQMLE